MPPPPSPLGNSRGDPAAPARPRRLLPGLFPDLPRARALPGGISGCPPCPGGCPPCPRVRAELRERFLLALAAARGLPSAFSLRSGIRVDAQFGAADREFRTLQVDSLQTPLGVEAAALLRGSDVLGFSFLLPEPPRE
ncbi:LOW QUALITY PROTEIN: gem-associated protein 7 [Manacus candei]|uniref:LOW QUALITY PROTEIN: gem-associated protein 7 n=1 Tax=Manacus candei TaxID=415023 RepID=UPI0022263488|nr:LOW QUALITY PROTEIN: gem-associated protein 7 [Manacus candei]